MIAEELTLGDVQRMTAEEIDVAWKRRCEERDHEGGGGRWLSEVERALADRDFQLHPDSFLE